MKDFGPFFLRKSGLLFAFFGCLQIAWSQPERLSFNHLTNQQGLINDYNWFVSKDSRGFVWVSSIYGLNRFDGMAARAWKPTTNPATDACDLTGENVLSPLFESPDGDLWFTTYDAVNCYRYREDCLQPFYPPDCLPDAPPPCENFAFGMDSLGQLWGVRKGQFLWSLDTRSGVFSTICPTIFEKAIPFFDPSGQLATALLYDMGGSGEVVFMKNGKRTSSKPVQIHSNAANPFPIRHAWFETDETAWICGPNGLARIAVKTGLADFSLPEKNLNSITPWLNRFLLCTTRDRGLLVFDIQKRVFVHQYQHDPNDPTSLSTDNLANVFVDESGGVWVSGFRKNVDFAWPGKQRFATFFEADSTLVPGKAEALFVKKMLEDEQGNLALGFQHGLLSIAPKSGLPLQPFTKLGHATTTLTSFLSDCTHFPWFMDVDGIWRIDPKTNKTELVGRPVDRKHFFFGGTCLPDGRVLLGNNLGVWTARNGPQKGWILAPEPGFDANSTWRTIHLDANGQLFLNCDESSIAVFKQENGAWKMQKTVLRTGPVNGWAETSEAVWAATSRGLCRIDKKNLDFRPIRCDICPDDIIVQSLLVESDSILWLGTGGGLFAFNSNTERFRKFGLADGLPSDHFMENATLRTSRGELLMASGPKIIQILPDENSLEQGLAWPVITQIRLNDEVDSLLRCTRTGAKNAVEIQQIILPFEKNILSLDLAALEFRNPSMNRLRYRLLGIHENWIETDGHTTVRIPQIQAGDYIFEVQAASPEGDWNPQTRRLEIEVLPPWYETWWFRGLLAGLVLGVFFLIYRSRVRRILWQERVRRNLARDLHDEVGSSLSAIEMFSRIAKNEHESTEIGQSFDKIRGIASQSQVAMRDLIWVLDSRLDTLGDAVGHMRDFAGPLAAARQIRLEFVHEKLLEPLRVKPKIRRNLYYIFREAFNNALKYAHCTAIEIHFSMKNDRLQMTIFDDGKGFDLPTVRMGEGQLNMARRAEDIQAKWQLKTAPGEGTRIFLEVKIG